MTAGENQKAGAKPPPAARWQVRRRPGESDQQDEFGQEHQQPAGDFSRTGSVGRSGGLGLLPTQPCVGEGAVFSHVGINRNTVKHLNSHSGDTPARPRRKRHG